MSNIFKVYKSSAWQEPEDVKKYSNSAWESCDSVKRYKDGAWTEIWSGKEYLTIFNSTLPSDTTTGRVFGSSELTPDDAYGIWHFGNSDCRNKSIAFSVPLTIPGTINLIKVDFDYYGLVIRETNGSMKTSTVGSVDIIYTSATTGESSTHTAVTSINTDDWTHCYTYFYSYPSKLAQVLIQFKFASSNINSAYDPQWNFNMGNLVINGKRYYMPK